MVLKLLRQSKSEQDEKRIAAVFFPTTYIKEIKGILLLTNINRQEFISNRPQTLVEYYRSPQPSLG